MLPVCPMALGGVIPLRGHVNDRAPHFRGLGARALADGQLPPLGQAEICNLKERERVFKN